MRAPLLLISGAGFPAWIWQDVRDALPMPAVVAPRPAAGTVTDYARAALEAAPQGKFTIVAHSAGGVVASELVRLAPGRVAGLIAIAAVIPAAGASFVSSLPFPNRLILPVIMRLAGTRPPESAVRKTLAAGLDEATVRRLLADLAPEPLSYFTSRTSSNTALATLPKTQYILTIDDPEIAPRLQRRYAARLNRPRIVEMPGGHLPMLAQAATLASAIADFVATQIEEPPAGGTAADNPPVQGGHEP